MPAAPRAAKYQTFTCRKCGAKRQGWSTSKPARWHTTTVCVQCSPNQATKGHAER